jgi:hypothetical protein
MLNSMQRFGASSSYLLQGLQCLLNRGALMTHDISIISALFYILLSLLLISSFSLTF